MSAQHTPGPWFAAPSTFYGRVTNWKVTRTPDNAQGDIANLLNLPGAGDPGANARLIAAAPELLAVVQGLVAWDEQDDIALDPVMEAARAAIAKAVSQ